jgi:hypothetical protein
MIRVLALLGLTACFVGGVLTYLLLPEPFGLLFSSSLVLAVIGLVALLGAAGLRLVRSRRRWTRSLALLPLLSAMAVVAAAAAVASDVRVLVFRGLPPHPTAAQWQEDLDYLADRMVALHPNLYGMVSQQRFDSVVAATRAAIPTQTAEATLMALFRVVALPNDAHTFPFLFIPAFDLHPFPLQAYTFDDGPYVVRAGRDYRETIGSRVIAVSGVPIAELYEGFAPYISAENEVGRLDRWTGLPLTEWLAARGLGGTNGAVVTLERPDGTRYDAAVRPVGLLPFGYWAYARQVARTSSPAVSGDRREAFWFEYDEPTESLYFDFNQSLPVWNGDSLRTVLAELDAFLDAHPCDRFIVDLRNNGGGDLGPARDVATFIAGDDRIDRRGRLFVLIGRRTFSAGAVAAALLRNTTTAVLLGEPTGQGSVFYAGPTIVTLPHSRLPIAISTRQTVGTLADEPGDRVAPDVPVPYTHEDFFAGRDPVREAALAHEAPSLATTHLDARTLTALTGRYRLQHAPAGEGDARRRSTAARDRRLHPDQSCPSPCRPLPDVGDHLRGRCAWHTRGLPPRDGCGGHGLRVGRRAARRSPSSGRVPVPARAAVAWGDRRRRGGGAPRQRLLRDSGAGLRGRHQPARVSLSPRRGDRECDRRLPAQRRVVPGVGECVRQPRGGIPRAGRHRPGHHTLPTGGRPRARQQECPGGAGAPRGMTARSSRSWTRSGRPGTRERSPAAARRICWAGGRQSLSNSNFTIST